MRALFEKFRAQVDGADCVKRVQQLCRIEMGQTFRHYHQSAEFILAEIKKAGIPNAEIKWFPADGKTAYQDKRMPIGWDATIGKLTLCDREKTVAADYTVHPFHLVRGSTATKKGGERVRILTQAQFLAGADARGALVLLDPTTAPRAQALVAILDRGGRGLISDFMKGYYEAPDDLQWVTACTEGANWHIECDDRDFIGFSVTPRMGGLIRQKATADALYADIECDGYRHEDTLGAITALIPGRRKEEIWLMAHPYEPLLCDDSNGVITGIEVAKRMMAEGMPHEYSLRILFASEFYGFAAFADTFEGTAVAAANLDSIAGVKGTACNLFQAPCQDTFYGNELMKQIEAEFQSDFHCKLQPPSYQDDMALSDYTFGLPTVWFLRQPNGFWHSSRQTKDDWLDADTVANSIAMASVWTRLMLDAKQPLRTPIAPVAIEKIPSPWRDYAEKQCYARIGKGFPYDLVRVPKAERRPIPESMIYGSFAEVVSRLDGTKNLAQIIREAETACKETFTEGTVRKYIYAIQYLAEYGYLKPVYRTEITEDDVVAALKSAGVEEGDLLVVHSAAGAFGYLQGGVPMLVRALQRAAGKNGTILVPAFTRPYAILGGLNAEWDFRPYDPADLSQIWTGTVPKVFLRDVPGILRSRHATHSWAGIGPLAAECLEAHGEADPPCSANSPLCIAAKHHAKVVFLGSSPASNTYLHCLEDELNLPYLKPALCYVKDADGSSRPVLIQKHLPGDRDFYRPDFQNSKFYIRLAERGIRPTEAKLGMGYVRMVQMDDLRREGLAMIKEDPRVLLCDDPACSFCSRY